MIDRSDLGEGTTLARLDAFGAGTLEILDFALTPTTQGERAAMTRMAFAVQLSWPSEWLGADRR